jgi:hypothetical protein
MISLKDEVMLKTTLLSSLTIFANFYFRLSSLYLLNLSRSVS